MKSQNVLAILRALLVTLLGVAILACQKDGRPQNPGLANTQGTAGGQTCEGTCDGGGGNGVNGKLYESYIKDPLELSAYKEKLSSIIDHMDQVFRESQISDAVSSGDAAELEKTKKEVANQKLFKNLFKMKKWYIAPISLATLEKDRIGLLFSKTQTEQIAFQTENEIWIDAKIFDKMNSAEQADLILHEYVMSLYLLKTKTFKDVCQIAIRAYEMKSEDGICGSFDDLPNTLAASQRLEKLQRQDYVRIRALTDYLKTESRKKSGQEIGAEFLRNGFDLRLFEGLVNDPFDSRSQEQTKISAQDVASLVRNKALQNRSPDLCSALNLNITGKCKLDVTGFKTPEGWPRLRMNLEFNELKLESVLHLADSSSLRREFDPVRGQHVYVLLLSTLAGSAGSKTASVSIYFKKTYNEEQKYAEIRDLEFVGLSYKPLVNLEPVGEGKYSTSVAPKATSVLSDSILISSETVNETLTHISLKEIGYEGQISK